MEFPDSGPVGGALRRRAGRAGQPQTAGRSGPVTGPRRHRRARGGPEHRDVAGSRARLGRQEPPSPRRALARCDRDPRIVARSGGYLIAPGPGELDLAVFTALAAEGHRLLGTDPAAAADKLRSALGLWRGPALPDLHVPELGIEASLLAERRQTVLEKRFEADLALGRHAELVPELSLDAIELWEAEGLTRGLGAAFIAPGICHRARRRFAEANRCRERAVEVFHALRDHHGEGFALTGVGAGFLAQQRYAEAVPYLKRTVEIFLRHDEPWGAGGRADPRRQRLPQTRPDVEGAGLPSLEMHRAIGDRKRQAVVLRLLAQPRTRRWATTSRPVPASPRHCGRMRRFPARTPNPCATSSPR